ncbi:MAG TPA: anti-phage ZorAB system protein ZorA [Patescibacteria group bacterium]|nr:anti-phage ZorAB system protein ZorA [Patescibacteria group bacterium]
MIWQMFVDAFNIVFPIIPVLKRPSLANASLILFIFIMLWLVYHYIYQRFLRQEIRPLLAALRQARALLQRPAEVSQEDHLEQVRQYMKADPRLGGLWDEYERTFIRSDAATGIEAIYSTVDAEFFFNEERILAAQGMNLQVYQAIPGYLTGMGILGTFWGLTVGLSQVNLASQDIEVLREGIRGLLEGIGTKFSTSLWGLVLSLLVSWYEKRKRNQVRHEIRDLQELLDQLCRRRPQEAWLADMLGENRRQTAALDRVNSEMAEALAEAVSRQFTRSVTPALNSLVGAIEELNRSGTSQVAQAISEGAGKQMALLGQVLDNVQLTLANTVSQSGELQEKLHIRMGEQVQDMSSTVRSVLDLAVSRQEEMSRQTEKKLQMVLQVMAENLTRQQDHLEQTTGRIGEDFVLKMDNIVSYMGTLLDSFEERSLQNLTQVSSELTQGTKRELGSVGDTLRTVQSALSDTTERAGNLQRELNEQTGSNIRVMARTVQEILDMAVERQGAMNAQTEVKIQQVLDLLTLSLTQQQAEMLSTVERTNAVQQQLHDQTGEHIRTMSTTVHEVLDGALSRQQEMGDRTQQKMQQVLDIMAVNLARQQASIEATTRQAGLEFAASMGSVSKETAGVMERFEQNMTHESGRMSAEFRQMADGFRQSFAEVAGRYQEERQQLAELLNQVRDTVAMFQDNVVKSGIAAAAFGEAATPVRDSVGHLKATLSEMQTFQQAFADIVQESERQMAAHLVNSQQSNDTVRESLQLTQSSWQAYETKFGLVRGDLDAVFDSLAEGLREYRTVTDESLSQFLERTQQSLSQCVGHLSTAIEELGETVEDLYPVLEKSKNS